MDVKEEVPGHSRPLRQDLARAYGAVLLGALSGVAVILSGWALLVEVFLWAGFLWALILGPVAFLALLLVRGASDRHASVGRLIGGVGGARRGLQPKGR